MIKQEDLILLNMAGVGKEALEKLSKRELQKKIVALQKEYDLEMELKIIKKYDVGVMTLFDANYPKLLKQIHSPPIILYSKGKLLEKTEFAVAIVGSRIASIYGLTTSEKLGYELASRGVVVVSGLAKGIDSAAHKGALKAYGRTIAVLGNGLKSVYPPENRKLAEEIVEKKGAVCSEFPMETPPIAGNFPRRNRIISGLSLGVIVVEASKNSGALITADFAVQQNREVFAVPGKIDSPTSFGSNALIKQGARIIQTAEDVIEELGLKVKESNGAGEERLKPNLSGDEMAVYNSISDEPKYLDDIVRGSRVALNKAMELLLKLQVKRLIKELPGKNFVRI